MPCAHRADLPSLPWLLIASACASYEPAPVDLARLPQAYAARRLDEPGLREFVTAFTGSDQAAWPPPALELPQLIAIGLFHRPELPLARAQLAQAGATHEIAAQLPNPKLAVGPGVVANPGDASRWLATVGLAFPLELGGKRDARMQAAASALAAARLEVARADQTIRAEVVERAFTLELRQHLAAWAQETAALHQQAALLVDKRAAVGAADAGEVAVARGAARRAVLAAAAADREADAAALALAAAVGVPATTLVGQPLSLPAAAVPPVDGEARRQLDDAAVMRRLDIAAALCSYAGSEAGLRLEVARQWPDVELGPGYEYDQGLHKFRLDVGITLPLFHGNGAAIERARAERTAAAVAVEAAQSRAITELAAAWQQLDRQQNELAAARELADAAITAAGMAQRRANSGADDALAVTRAQLDAVEARATLAQQEYALRIDWLRLEQALQQPVGSGLLAWRLAVPEVRS
jgi:outer membrane protein TolC